MAIYRYNILLIPRKSVLDRFKIIPTESITDFFAIDKQGHEFEFWDEDWWPVILKYEHVSPKPEEKYPQIEWTKPYPQMKNYGNTEANDISYFLNDEGFVKNIHVRIDVNAIDQVFIDFVIQTAVNLDCLFLDRQGFVFKPTIVDLEKNIKSSNAFRFVSNPTDFFDKLQNGQYKME